METQNLTVHEKIQQGYYKNQLTYVGHPVYKASEDTELQEFVGTIAQIKQFEANRKEVFDAYSKEQREAYGRETARLEELFKADLAEENGLTGHPKADKLFELAWSHGHSSGYGDVDYYYSEFSALLID